MFVTTPDLEQWVPKGLGPEDCKYWRAVALTTESPWYFLTHSEAKDALRTPQTMLVAWETTLRLLLEQVEPRTLLSMHSVVLMGDSGDWKVCRIGEVWLPGDDEAVETGPLLFKLHGELNLVDSHQNLRAISNPGRRLLARIPS